MKKYRVWVREVYVCAESEDEAIGKVRARIDTHMPTPDDTLEYSHELPAETWTIEETEGDSA